MRRITYWLTLILIFMIPWEDSISIPAMGSLPKIVGLVVAACWAATILMEGKFRKPHLFHALVLIFFLWNFVSVFWTLDISGSTQRTKTYFQIFLLLLIFWEVFQKPENLLAGLQAYIFGAYVLIASTVYNYINGNVSVAYEGRYSATGVNAVDLTLILTMGLPIALMLFFASEQNKKSVIVKLINLAYIPLAIFSIILTGSRTSLIAVIPFGIYLVVTQQIKFDRKILVFGLLMISLLAMLPFIPQSITARLGTLGASVEAGDLGGRGELWQQSLLVFSEHPIAGLGSGTLNFAIGSAAHNTFVSIATETGLIGLMLFLAILAVVFFTVISIPNGTSGLWVVIFLTWVIGVNSLSWEFRKLTWLFFNFIVIEGSFAYEQINIGQSKVIISKNIKRFLNINDLEVKIEAG